MAALLRITQRLKLLKLINQICPKREQGPGVGHCIILAALNRAIGNWYEQTILRRLWGWNKSVFSSQRFWDHVDRLSEDSIEKIQRELVFRVEEEFGVNSRVLLYDTTNFFAYHATTNDRCRLAQRGHSKQKRRDLRLLGLALLVTRDFQIPLFHHLYQGNIPDVSLFARLGRTLQVGHSLCCSSFC